MSEVSGFPSDQTVKAEQERDKYKRLFEMACDYLDNTNYNAPEGCKDWATWWEKLYVEEQEEEIDCSPVNYTVPIRVEGKFEQRIIVTEGGGK